MVTRAFWSGSLLAIVVAAILFCQSSPPAVFAQDSESRTWRDATGAFSVQAKLIEHSATDVKLRTSAGQEISVPIARLSEGDVEYLKNLAAPAASESAPSDSERPAVPVTVATPPGPDLLALAGGAETAPDGAELPGEGDVKAPLQNEPPQGLATDPAVDWKPLPKGGFTVGSSDAYDQVGRTFVINGESGTVALSIGRHKIDEPEKARGRIFLGQLPQGPLQTVLEVSEGASLIDFEPTSGQALMLSGFDHSMRGGDLVLLNGLADGKPEPLFKRRLPGIDKPGSKPQVKWARFLSAEHAACVVDRELYVWNLRTATLLYKIEKIDGLRFPAVSPNRRYMAIPRRAGAVIIDVVDGSSQGFVALGESLTPCAVFHPDGRRIAVAANNQLLVWDCVEGRPTCEVTMPGQIGALLGWVEPDGLLTGLGRLIRTDLEMTVWGYSLSGAVEPTCCAGGVLFTKKGSSCLLASMPIPHPAADKAATELATGGQAMMLIRPGTKVALDAQVPGGTDREMVISALGEAVEKTGWQVVDRAETNVVAIIGQGEEQKLSYRMMERGQSRDSASVETATIRPFTAEIQIRRGGEVLWTRETRNHVPSFLFLKKDQTLQEAVKEFERPNAAFFAQLTIPPRIPKPEIADGLGLSLLKDLTWQDTSAADLQKIRARSWAAAEGKVGVSSRVSGRRAAAGGLWQPSAGGILSEWPSDAATPSGAPIQQLWSAR